MAEVKPFGCMVEAYPGKTGLVHVSELDVTRTADASECLCHRAHGAACGLLSRQAAGLLRE